MSDNASPLQTMTQTTTTALWNDSADPRELAQSIEWGAVGATCNPVIAVTCVKADLPRWSDRMREIAAELPHERAIHDMKKEELVAFIREARGIKESAPAAKKKHPVKIRMAKPALKARKRPSRWMPSVPIE